ncbi:MAG: orotidine-5'-phosphate decarboxylase [Acidobacteriota bacterium]
MKSERRVIVALDVETADDAREIIAQLGAGAAAFKIGLQLFTSAGPEFVREVAADHRVFLDLKFHDIPNTVAKAGIEAARLGVWMFNVHASGGSEMMSETVRHVQSFCKVEDLPRPLIIGVTVLTSSDANALREAGIERSAKDQVLRLAHLASECGLDGVVSSPQEVLAIRNSVTKPGFLIVTPGVRPDFATNDDQKRVTTPGQAVSEGSDYLVIGRPILQADDRAAALRKLCEEIEAADK